MKVPSIKNLRKELKKNYPDHHSLYAKIFMDKITIYVTWVFLYTNITANQVTVLSTIVAVGGSFFFLYRDPIYWILGFLFLQIFRLLDGVDGEIARYKKNVTELGKRLEKVSHKIVDFVVFSCIAFGVYFIFNNLLILVLGLSVAFSKVGFGLIACPKKVKKKYQWNSNIITKISHEVGSFFQFTIIPALLDLFFRSTIFRLLFVIISGVFFPLVFIWRLYKFWKSR